MIEIEVKARVDDARKIERAIISMGATPIGIQDQADTYYNAPHRNFETTDEALRCKKFQKL
ncbi:MAG: CYTH domain-containing protein [Candidatus Methanoperedens sp.]|nr:CYTH domain-containing protein [Candidatus Methanoperedens sp.]